MDFSFIKRIKFLSSTVVGAFGLITTIGGAVLYVEGNYAHAGDVKALIKNQEQQVRQSQLFQMEYYDEKIKTLTNEKRRVEASQAQKSQSKFLLRSPTEVQDEINDVKHRRDIIRRSLESGMNSN